MSQGSAVTYLMEVGIFVPTSYFLCSSSLNATVKENWFTFSKVIVKIKAAPFLWPAVHVCYTTVVPITLLSTT